MKRDDALCAKEQESFVNFRGLLSPINEYNAFLENFLCLPSTISQSFTMPKAFHHNSYCPRVFTFIIMLEFDVIS